MKLNYKRTFLIGLAFMSISAFWTFYDQCIPYIMKYTHGQDELVTNSIMAIDNILALFLLPLFGALSDRTRTPWGRRTPYIVLGTVFSVVFFMLMGIGANDKDKFWLFFAMLFLMLVALGTYRSPAVSLMPDLTPRVHRSRANAIINLMGTAGGAFSLLMSILLIESTSSATEGTVYAADQNYWPLFIAVGAFMLVTVVIFFFTVPEKKIYNKMVESGELTEEDLVTDDAPKGIKGERLEKPVFRSLIFMLLSVAFWYMAYNGITTSLSRYCQEVMGMGLNDSSAYVLVALVIAAVAFLPLGILSSRFGRKKMILGGVVLMLVSFIGASFLRAGVSEIWLYLVFAAVGIGWASINVNSYPMVVEMSKNADIGRYTGYYYTFSMAAQVFTPVLTGFLISEKYLDLGYVSLFPYAAIFMVLAFVTMLFVKHGDVIPEKKSLLEHFDSAD